MAEEDMAAIALQLQELDSSSQYSDAGAAAASSDHRSELESHHRLLTSPNSAQSIGAARSSEDAATILLTTQENQRRDDQLNTPFTTELMSSFSPDSVPNNPPLRGNLAVLVAAGIRIPEQDISTSAAAALLPEDSHTDITSPPMHTHSLDLQEPRIHNCVVCYESLAPHQVITIPCNDTYCQECLRMFFMRACNDETLLPVRCHGQPIPFSLVSNYLSSEEIDNFQRAHVEHSTPNRVYCSKLDCGNFLTPQTIESGTHKAVCEKCQTTTCALCKSSWHEGMDCPKDEPMRATREMAAGLGWQTCYRCHSVVSIQSGCNHITCRCNAEFCYECGTPWKNCPCEVTNVERLLEGAEEAVVYPAAIPLPRPAREWEERQERRRLGQEHECPHVGPLERMRGGRRSRFLCDGCGFHWRRDMYRCNDCRFYLCNDCRGQRGERL